MTEPDGEDAIDEVVHEEMRATFESQVERLREIDSKAIEILKANLLLVGIFVTGASILTQTGVEFGGFVNIYTLFASFLLLCSTALAGITYTSSNIRGGIDTDALDKIARRGYTEDEFTDALAESYGRWIEYNAEVTAVNDILVTVTILLVIDAFVFLVAGVTVGVVEPPLALSIAGFAVLVAVVGWATRLVYHMDHINSPRNEPPPFEGVRVSKGASRSDGYEALKRMLQKTKEDDDGVG